MTTQVPAGVRAALLGLALLILAGVLGFFTWQWRTLELINPGWAMFLRIVLFGLPILVLTGAAIIGLVIAWQRFGRIDVITQAHNIELTRATVQRFPESLTSLSFHDSSRPVLPAPSVQGEIVDVSPAAPQYPTFAELLAKGIIGPGRPFLLGLRADTGEPLEGGWETLYSCGIGALPGAGKSWLAAFLLCQSVLQGGKLIVCDLHAGDPESLATRIAALAPAFMCNVAKSQDEILAALKLANDKLQKRIDGSGARWPIIVAVDEWTSLLRTKVGEKLPEYVENFAEEGRKYNVNAMLSAQGWTKDSASVVRNRLTSHYVMRQRPEEARYQLGLVGSTLPLDIRFLPVAHAYLLTVRGELVKVVIPAMSSSDIERVGDMLAGTSASVSGSPFGFGSALRGANAALLPAAAGTAREPDRSQPSAGSEAQALSPEAARVRDLFFDGKDMSAIVRELRGIDPKTSGSRYQTALKEITELLRQAMKGQ